MLIFLIAGYLTLIILLGYLANRVYFSGTQCESKNRLDDKIVVITGGNSGIGFETSLDLANRGAWIVIACPDLDKSELSANKIIQQTKNKNIFIEKLDLASTKSINDFNKRIRTKFDHIDILINNAGFTSINKWTSTDDGFEMHMGVNYLGHFLLTKLLLDLIKASKQGRIINVSSEAHNFLTINFEDLNSKKSYNRILAYGRSKLAINLFTLELSKQLKDTNCVCVCLHPGVVRTNMAQKYLNHLKNHLVLMPFLIFYPLWPLISKSSKEGAQTSIYCSVTDFDIIKRLNGCYLKDCKPAKSSAFSTNEKNAEKLWIETEKLFKFE